MADPFVRIHLDQRRKLRFKHKDLREVVAESGRTLGDLITDQFGGWPWLLRYGLRWQDLAVSLDKASEFLDIWVTEPDPDTKQKREMGDLGLLLLAALNASGFVKIEAEKPLDKDVEDAEGNARPEAVATLTEA